VVKSAHIANEAGGGRGTLTYDSAGLERLLFSHANDASRKARHEWWCLWRLLCQSKMRLKIDFPVRIEKSDPPDFLIYDGRQKIALDITKATFQRYEQIKMHFRGMEGKAVLDLDPSLFSDRMLRPNDGPNAWRQYIRNPEDGLIGCGWIRNEPEESLAEAIESALARKILAPCDSFPAACAGLIVDASDHFPGIHSGTICVLIQNKLLPALNRFDFVAVDFGSKDVYLWGTLIGDPESSEG
jgi:hypothetical protein